MGGSILTLYSTISGGLDWRNAADPLSNSIGPSMTVMFCIFIAFTTFSLLNIVTGVFVEAALQNTKEEADLNMVDRLWEVFNIEKLPANGRISYFDFVNHLENVQMKSYFKSVDLDISEAKNLFRLLDIDDSGSIQAEDFVVGCLRLRGSAKAIDLATLMLETRRYHRKTQTQIAKLHDLCQRMDHDAGTRGTALVSLAQRSDPDRSDSELPVPSRSAKRLMFHGDNHLESVASGSLTKAASKDIDEPKQPEDSQQSTYLSVHTPPSMPPNLILYQSE
jgi:hypothetical protein